MKYIFGPVPSRRLGLSLGVDLVPAKTCTYDCLYCQVGRTTNKTLETRPYVPINDVIEELKPELFISRLGDDLYIEVEAEEGEEENRKLTVSVATASPISSMIHLGINVSSENTPVPTLGLEDLGVPVDEFIIKVLQNFINEMKGLEEARSKVRGVS